MKAGILTIQNIANYGACWQSYALYKYVLSLGYDCEIIDLLTPVHSGYMKSRKIKHYYKNNIIRRTIRTIICKFKGQNELSGYGNVIKEEKFKEFNQLIQFSKTYHSSDELYKHPPLYDIYIAGSDQIWNPTLGFDFEAYFLTFVDNSRKKISYASSFGRKNIEKKFLRKIKKYIRDFKQISVREKSGITILQQCIDKPITAVLDPVFLLSYKEWGLVAKEYNLPTDKFLLIFSLTSDDKLFYVASEVAKKKNLEILAVLGNATSKIEHSSEYSIHLLLDVGPSELLYLIAKAEIVLTNSFHGTAMSIILAKNFFSFIKSSEPLNERQENILSLMKLTEHLVYDYTIDTNKIPTYDRDALNAILYNESNKSRLWLDQALKI